MNAGILTPSGIASRSNEIIRFDNASTTVEESPIPIPLIADVVTASVGHIPSVSTRGRILFNNTIIKSFYTFIQSPHLPSFLPQACKLQAHNLHPFVTDLEVIVEPPIASTLALLSDAEPSVTTENDATASDLAVNF